MSEINLVCRTTVFHWYGVRFTDTAGKSIKLTPQVGTVVSAGRISMPAGLNGDGTYGVDIDLPGVAAIPEANISVLVIPTRPAISAISSQYITGGTFYYNTMYANSAASYYSRNDTTGVMSAWSAGARTAGDKTTWNSILAVSPVAFWDKRGATTFTSIRLFAASAYMLAQPAADINYSLAGSASGSGGQEPPGNVCDNNEATWYGNYFWVSQFDRYETSGSMSATATVTFAAQTVYRAEVKHSGQLACSGGSAGGSGSMELYYGGAWHTVLTFSWGNNSSFARTDVVYGAWGSVTAIRISGTCHGRKSTGYSTAYGDYGCAELRAWGTPMSYLQRYQVGSAIIPSVDYVISVKEWNF